VQYSALTASSKLQELEISAGVVEGAAWAHVFPAGRQLSQLRMLSLGFGRDPDPLDSTAIARLAICCPAVEYLVLTPAEDASLAPVRSLTALTHLHVGSVSPAVIRSDLAAMSQLQSLDVSVSGVAADGDASSGLQHLVPLTALTRLTHLSSSPPFVTAK
jgi:hypothetical protein